MRFRFPLSVIAVVAAVTVSHAQDFNPPKPHVRDGAVQVGAKPVEKPWELPPIVPNPKWSTLQNSTGLLLDKHVQADLGLSSDTVASLVRIYGDFNDKYTALTKADGAKSDLEAQLDTILVDAANKAAAALSPTEQARLKQLGVQAMGFDAFRLADVRAAMSLSADQGKQLDQEFTTLDTAQQALEGDLGQQMGALKDPGPQATTEEREAYKQAQLTIVTALNPRERAIERDRKADFDALIASFSDTQKTVWTKKVLGPPVKLPAPTN